MIMCARRKHMCYHIIVSVVSDNKINFLEEVYGRPDKLQDIINNTHVNYSNIITYQQMIYMIMYIYILIALVSVEYCACLKINGKTRKKSSIYIQIRQCDDSLLKAVPIQYLFTYTIWPHSIVPKYRQQTFFFFLLDLPPISYLINLWAGPWMTFTQDFQKNHMASYKKKVSLTSTIGILYSNISIRQVALALCLQLSSSQYTSIPKLMPHCEYSWAFTQLFQKKTAWHLEKRSQPYFWPRYSLIIYQEDRWHSPFAYIFGQTVSRRQSRRLMLTL